MTSKLEKFIAQVWRDAKDNNGRKVFTDDTFEAARKLQHHISSECLSNIPPGGGTNRNECLHKQLNSLFTRSKMGILLAYALLTIILYAHNSTERVHGRMVRRSINASNHCGSAAHNIIEPIGIMCKVREHDMRVSDHWEIDVSENTLDMEINKHKIMKTLQMMGLSRLPLSSHNFTQLFTLLHAMIT